MTTAPLLEARGITKRFGGLFAVKDVHLAIEAGEIVGLIGPNGAGKTTLFAVLSGFLRPEAGAVWFDGRSVAKLPPEELAHLGLCRTFQLVKPFANLTVLQNVMVGAFARCRSTSQAAKEAARILDFTGMAHLRDVLAKTLPVALRKRLEIARALGTHPRLLLLDEVIAGLTPTEIKAMLDLLLTLHREGITLFIIEHVMAVIMSLCQRILVLHHGEKIAEGLPAQIARHPRVVQAYLGEEYLLAQG